MLYKKVAGYINGQRLTRGPLVNHFVESGSIEMEDRRWTVLAKEAVQLSYIAVETRDGRVERTRRVSVWTWGHQEWRLISHSSSSFNDDQVIEAAERFARALQRITPQQVGDFQQCPSCLRLFWTNLFDPSLHQEGCDWIAAVHYPMPVGGCQ